MTLTPGEKDEAMRLIDETDDLMVLTSLTTVLLKSDEAELDMNYDNRFGEDDEPS